MSQDQPEIIFAHTTAIAAGPNRGVTPKNLGAKFTPRSALSATDNLDGHAGKVLYIAFIETTGFLQSAVWNFCSWERVERYPGNHVLNRYVDTGDCIPGVNVMGGVWYGAYCSDNRRGDKNSIRKQILHFVHINGISQCIKIIVTGKSLGGAIAQCTALNLCFRTDPGKVKLVLFASPRVGVTVSFR